MMNTTPQSTLASPADLAEAIVEQMAEALIFADREGVIRAWNPAATALFGFAADQAVGRSLDLIIPERLRAPHWEGYDRAIARGVAQHYGESRITRALTDRGETIYVDMSFAVISDSDGQALGALAIARNATLRHQQEKALRERLAVLEQGAANSQSQG